MIAFLDQTATKYPVTETIIRIAAIAAATALVEETPSHLATLNCCSSSYRLGCSLRWIAYALHTGILRCDRRAKAQGQHECG